MDIKYPSMQKMATRLIKKGDKLRSKLTHPYSVKKGDGFMLLLKYDGQTSKWTFLGKVLFFEVGFDSFRNRKTFDVPTIEHTWGINANQSFDKAVAIATHVVLFPQNEFYNLGDADETKIISLGFTYKLFGQLVGDKLTDEELTELLS